MCAWQSPLSNISAPAIRRKVYASGRVPRAPTAHRRSHVGMATQRADATGRWKPLHAFACALLLPFQRSFAFACVCSFATFGVPAACCRAGCCGASLANLLPHAFLSGLDSGETSLFLNFVESRGRSARVRHRIRFRLSRPFAAPFLLASFFSLLSSLVATTFSLLPSPLAQRTWHQGINPASNLLRPIDSLSGLLLRANTDSSTASPLGRMLVNISYFSPGLHRFSLPRRTDTNA